LARFDAAPIPIKYQNVPCHLSQFVLNPIFFTIISGQFLPEIFDRSEGQIEQKIFSRSTRLRNEQNRQTHRFARKIPFANYT